MFLFKSLLFHEDIKPVRCNITIGFHETTDSNRMVASGRIVKRAG